MASKSASERFWDWLSKAQTAQQIGLLVMPQYLLAAMATLAWWADYRNWFMLFAVLALLTGMLFALWIVSKHKSDPAGHMMPDERDEFRTHASQFKCPSCGVQNWKAAQHYLRMPAVNAATANVDAQVKSDFFVMFCQTCGGSVFYSKNLVPRTRTALITIKTSLDTHAG